MTLHVMAKDNRGKRPKSPALVVGFVCVTLFVMCATGNEKTFRVTTKQNGGSISLQKGDLLEVTLPAVLGTGFSWRIRNGADPLLRAKEQRVVKKSESEKEETGKTEYQIFQFESKITGTARLELEYVRLWEKEGSPAKTFSLTVHVQ